MRVLIACEYSATVRDAFRTLGHDAWSVDIVATEGDPQWHYQGDALYVARRYGPWDLMVAFPPCTDLATSGARWWPEKQADGRQQKAARFVRSLWNVAIPRVVIENPQGWLNRNWLPPTQYIEPYQHGEPWRKRTCLWIRGLPPLEPSNVVTPDRGGWVDGDGKRSERIPGGRHRNPRERGRTFAGIANAMAAQWGAVIEETPPWQPNYRSTK